MELPSRARVTRLGDRLSTVPRPRAVTTGQSERLRRRLSIAAVAVPAVIVVATAWSRRWTADDAFIDFRVVHNILGGHGPVFNAGDRVEAFTSPAWVAMLTVLSFVTRAAVEWVAVVLGMVLSTAGFVCAGRAGVLLMRRDAREGRPVRLLPFGTLMLAALPPVWDFSTSGLETGAELGWLGAGFLLLTRLVVHDREGGRPAPRTWPVALLLGMGPLVRPEFVLFATVWTCVLLFTSRPGRRRALGTIAIGIAPAFGYEIFRMGYFATLVPNTALAKEAGSARWSAGLHYLANTFTPYLLAIPVGVLLLWWIQRTWRREDVHRAKLLLSAATMAAALLDALYVVRLGGDFMHARMLLPALFTLALPVAVVPLSTSRDIVAWSAVAVWALVCITTLRLPFASKDAVVDERTYWVQIARESNPVTLQDHAQGGSVWIGRYLSDAAHSQRSVVLWSGLPDGVPGVPAGTTVASLQQPVVATMLVLGQDGVAAGPDVYIVDRFGLVDEVGARLTANLASGRVGHQKLLPDDWVLARFADPASLRGLDPRELAAVAAARSALTCDGPLHDLLAATTAPLSPARFLDNLAHAWGYTTMRIPPDTTAARQRFCDSAALSPAASRR